MPGIPELQAVLATKCSRLTSIFADWDEDGTGQISKREFRQALMTVGIAPVPREVANALFDSLDEERSGILEYSAIERKLKKARQRASASSPAAVANGGGGGGGGGAAALRNNVSAAKMAVRWRRTTRRRCARRR